MHRRAKEEKGLNQSGPTDVIDTWEQGEMEFTIAELAGSYILCMQRKEIPVPVELHSEVKDTSQILVEVCYSTNI